MDIEHTPVKYAAVIVDEVQDFTETMMRLVKKIAGDGPNRLLLVGDGQQSIYHGGSTLKGMGISVVGRSRILRQNYRNTRQILEAAYNMMQDTPFDDVDEDQVTPDRPQLSQRSGPRPIVWGFETTHNETDWISEQIHPLVCINKTYLPEDIAVFYREYSHDHSEIINKIQKYGIACESLKNKPLSNSVKYETFHSSKGLEFKVVFLLGVTDGIIPPTRMLRDPDVDDDIQRERRLLYVAMTRSRDLLYISYSGGSMSRFLRDIEPELLDFRGDHAVTP